MCGLFLNSFGNNVNQYNNNDICAILSIFLPSLMLQLIPVSKDLHTDCDFHNLINGIETDILAKDKKEIYTRK